LVLLLVTAAAAAAAVLLFVAFADHGGGGVDGWRVGDAFLFLLGGVDGERRRWKRSKGMQLRES